jgi:deoxyribodipyrimidine photo-lyase
VPNHQRKIAPIEAPTLIDNSVAPKFETMPNSSSLLLESSKNVLSTALMWFRRDLRASDNAALFHALKNSALKNHAAVYCAFVFDTDILQGLPRQDRRVAFIRESLVDLDAQLQKLSSGGARLLVLHGRAADEIPRLAVELGATSIYANHDDEPDAIRRDATVAEALRALGAALHTFKDHVIFERQEVLTQMGKPYTVFTPYKNAWLKKLVAREDDFYLNPYPTEKYAHALQAIPDGLRAAYALPSLAALGFERTNLCELAIQTGSAGAQKLLADFAPRMSRYQETRDFPAVKGPSYLSVHLRFGTVSIRQLASLAYKQACHASPDELGAATWLSELIWRDFYHQIMANFPHAMTSSFKLDYDRIQWEQGAAADKLFVAWCEACTGYPLVDAAMRQLNQTGYMHNRLRMVVASFLTKDLGLDWRWGERYFAEKLIDFDLAANNGGWQWAASSGCDAQPYFRIFNPTSQSEKFDPKGKFIRRYMPELAHLDDKEIHVPKNPIVHHGDARAKTLARYVVVKN